MKLQKWGETIGLVYDQAAGLFENGGIHEVPLKVFKRAGSIEYDLMG